MLFILSISHDSRKGDPQSDPLVWPHHVNVTKFEPVSLAVDQSEHGGKTFISVLSVQRQVVSAWAREAQTRPGFIP